jgi:hypothetical protein
MNAFRSSLVSLLLGASTLSAFAATPVSTSTTPVYDTTKPWTRWWWPGSAVDKADLTKQLEQFAAAGLGGVEITPIYGARGAEERYLPYLSPQWVGMLEHVGKEARRLGLGVDMATGTGWPFGGPWITEADSLQKLVLKDGKLSGEPNRMMVKRAAPGGEGLVLDPYSATAMNHYLARFDEALGKLPPGFIRSQFHDSFEYYGGAWTPAFEARFEAMHGYSIQPYAARLLGQEPADPDLLARLKSDYRDTLAVLHQEYLDAWKQWAHRHGSLVRNQSHGAPGNLLDLYANADIPETEVFGSTPFPIPGLRRNADEIRSDQDLPEPLVLRLASSAAHVAGRPLASSETCTWLRDHWKVSLAYTKPEIDRLFACGINHLFYHGTVYSPADAAWPGWLFYASTQFNPSNPWWDDFPALNAYVTRVQAVLQSGAPDSEVLLYWPIEDVWNDPQGTMKQLGMHDVKWMTGEPVGRLASALVAQGYGFDYVSDAFLQRTEARDGQFVTPGGSYRVLLVPATRRMPLETLQRLAKLAGQGAPILFESMPEDVPGLGRLEERRAQFQSLAAKLAKAAHADTPVLNRLAALSLRREPMVEQGLSLIRRRTGTGNSYFVTNLSSKTRDGWVALGAKAVRSVLITDPLSGHQGLGALRQAPQGGTEVLFQLAPGESCLLETNSPVATTGQVEAWSYTRPGGSSIVLAGRWHVEFLKGGPVLPASYDTQELRSWTDQSDPELQRFAGTARYTLHFQAPPQKAQDWLLELGDLRESARVRLNGVSLGTLWSLPFHVKVGSVLKPGENVLELEVTNLAANRIRDLDRRKVDWKIMREINFVDIRYRPFDASAWPLTPSGLLGPVTLIPLVNQKLETTNLH